MILAQHQSPVRRRGVIFEFGGGEFRNNTLDGLDSLGLIVPEGARAMKEMRDAGSYNYCQDEALRWTVFMRSM